MYIPFIKLILSVSNNPSIIDEDSSISGTYGETTNLNRNVGSSITIKQQLFVPDFNKLKRNSPERFRTTPIKSKDSLSHVLSRCKLIWCQVCSNIFNRHIKDVPYKLWYLHSIHFNTILKGIWCDNMCAVVLLL